MYGAQSMGLLPGYAACVITVGLPKRREPQMDPNVIIGALPWLCQRLRQQPTHLLPQLTAGAVQQCLCGIDNAYPGVYLFSLVQGNVPLYVGRTANLPVRIGDDHRSIDQGLALVTRALMQERNLQSVNDARTVLFQECQVQMLIEPDAGTRALLEIYAALQLETRFNRIQEA